MAWLQKYWLLLFSIILVVTAGAVWYWRHTQEPVSLVAPFIRDNGLLEAPLQQYAIPRLAQRTYQPSQITIEEELNSNDDFTSYVFSYQTLGKKMTGQLNVPNSLSDGQSAPVIIMLRGYVPPEIFETGVGTRNGAAYFARNGFITLAPDFFSYGGSDPEPSDTWQARFEKPISVIELIRTVQAQPIPAPPTTTIGETENLTTSPSTRQITTSAVGLWGHSNGGQIALTTLEILSEPIPTTLWAPVTAPFPYSILFFSDEYPDEGKETRKYVSLFEKEYDIFDFSLTQHLNRLTGPLQLHHGTADEAALKVWSDEFLDKITVENNRRQKLRAAQATTSAGLDADALEATGNQLVEPIDVTYHIYPGADHNLQPGWDTVVARDLEFFRTYLKTP